MDRRFNNVDVDDRGLVYGVDRAGTGIHILEFAGAARAIVEMPPRGRAAEE